MSTQFIRLPAAALHATDRQLGTVALKATAAWLMAIPGYRAPHGGIKAQLRRYFRKGSAFEAAWRSTNRNHLHLLRAPSGDDRFHTYYEFSVSAAPADGLRYLTAADGRRQAAQAARHTEPTGSYVPVPVWLLKDAALSPAAKSVVLLAIEELALAKNLPAYTAAKSAMIARAGVPATSFEAAWREAKAAGYIWQEREMDPATGLFAWSYFVAADPDEAAAIRQAYAGRAKRAPVRRRAATPKIGDGAPAAAAVPAERRAIRELIHENISVEALLSGCRTAPLYYTEEDIRGYVRLLVDTVCSSLPTIRIGRQELPTQTVREVFLRLNAGHILYVMERLQGVQGVRDPLAYKRTALYNAAVTYGEYAMGIQQTA